METQNAMSGIIGLSYKERSELERVLKSCIKSKVYQRAQALLLLDEGEAVEQVAELLRVSHQTLYNWMDRFEQRRELKPSERLADAARSGRPVTAQGVIDPLMDEIIDTDPRDYGFNSTVWTAELIQRYLAEEYGHEVSVRSVGYALERLHIRWKRPRHVLACRDPRWRQAKGGSNAASGRGSARSS
jgi:transposase